MVHGHPRIVVAAVDFYLTVMPGDAQSIRCSSGLGINKVIVRILRHADINLLSIHNIPAAFAAAFFDGEFDCHGCSPEP